MQLIFVSNNAISKGDKENPFFLQEKEWLCNEFNSFTVICDAGIYNCFDNHIALRHRTGLLDKARGVICAVTDRNVYKEIRHMFGDQKISLSNVLKVFRFSINGSILCQFIRKQLSGLDSAILYSYWLSYDAYACAIVKETHPDFRFISRAHSYEIQMHRNVCNPYLMKRFICDNADKIAFISNDSYREMKKYHNLLSNSDVIYLGSTEKGSGFIQREAGTYLGVLTCSAIIELKQLDWMIAALSQWDERSPVHWIHIGDGPEKDKIVGLAEKELSDKHNISYEFVGAMPNNLVHQYMSRKDINLFVNMSRTEGVPVTIMEAMSTGLPVIAPAINGIPELVDDKSGILFNLEDGAIGLCQAIKEFCHLSEEQKEQMGWQGYKKWEEQFCLENNLKKIFDFHAQV